jgi:hypothetical protein
VEVAWETPLAAIASDAFESVSTRNVYLKVPGGTYELYSDAPVWKEFEISRIVTTSGPCGEDLEWFLDVADSVLTITGTGPMFDWETSNRQPWYPVRFGIKRVEIEDSATSIGNNAFYGCTGITEITIGDSVTSIGDYAFSHCSGLTSVTIGNNVTNIGNSAFSYCSGLTSITIPNSVTSIGSSAFYYCSELTSITIPNSVTSIGNNAFRSCTSISTVNFNADSCITMGARNYIVFVDCSNLTTINIGENVKRIPNYALTLTLF